jgi:hypothetical protein
MKVQYKVQDKKRRDQTEVENEKRKQRKDTVKEGEAEEGGAALQIRLKSTGSENKKKDRGLEMQKNKVKGIVS